jgi:hypothetical protein
VARTDLTSRALVFIAALALAYGVWSFGENAELTALYWLIAGALALKAASDRERWIAAR